MRYNLKLHWNTFHHNNARRHRTSIQLIRLDEFILKSRHRLASIMQKSERYVE